MRRLWSHIIITATSLLMIGATFNTVFTKIDSNIEFESGRELVFRVMQKDDDGNIDKEFVFGNDEAVKETAKIMEERLKTAEISRYKIETQGNDTIKVSFTQDTDQQYRIIENYLSFNATLAISNSKETYALATEFLNPDKKAYLETSANGLPAVVIPINFDNEMFQAVYTEAKEMADSGTGEVVQKSDSGQGEEGEGEEIHFAYLYLWYNYIEDYYSYSKINQNSPDTYDPTIANKILMTFDAANPFLDDKNDALRSYIRPGIEEGQEITPESLKDAYENGRYFVNLLNSGEMRYHVEFLFSHKADLWVEDLFALGNHMTVAFSRILIATLCAIAVTALLLIYFYRLGALSVITTTLVSTYLGLILVISFGVEFNIATLIGLLTLAIASIVSGIIYLNKIKEECYRGRSLKKANEEAYKRAFLPIIDVHVILVAIGVSCYLLGGIIMKAFAVVTIIGGLISLVINLLGLRGLLWLITNEQKLAGRYDLFDVSDDQVPNVLEEEKQKYYGPNAEKDFRKRQKPIAIVSLILLVASVTSLIVFGSLNDGAVYHTTPAYGNSQIYVEYTSATEENTALSADIKAKIDTMLAHSYLDNQKLVDIVEVENYDYVSRYESTASGVDTVYYAYYRINFDRPLDGEEVISYRDNNNHELFNEEASVFFTMDTLNSITGANLNFSPDVELSLKNSVRVNADHPSFAPIYVATIVGLGIGGLYLLLRYRLTRGLASLLLNVVTVTITAGIFSLLHFLPVTSYVGVALPFVAFFVSTMIVLLMDKERSLLADERIRDNSVETRGELLNKANSLSSTPIIISFILVLYLSVNYFAFTSGVLSWIFLLIILGASASVVAVLFLFAPCAHFFHKILAKIMLRTPKPKKKKKARPARVSKSAEPEEAIFIGINDY